MPSVLLIVSSDNLRVDPKRVSSCLLRGRQRDVPSHPLLTPLEILYGEMEFKAANFILYGTDTRKTNISVIHKFIFAVDQLGASIGDMAVSSFALASRLSALPDSLWRLRL